MDSNEVSLGMVDVDSSDVDVFYALQDADPSHAFLKGLCIVDDIAFFGIAPSSPRSSRADKDLECELAAYDLLNHKLLYRTRLPTDGLLNVVAAPQLAVRICPSFVEHPLIVPAATAHPKMSRSPDRKIAPSAPW